MEKESLNDLFFKYSEGSIKRKEFEGAIYQYFVNNQENTCLSHWKRDEYEDYISWFYPRFHKVIDAYQEIGSSFDAFMNKFLLISSKEYRVRITTNNVTEYSAWSARVPDLYTHEEVPAYLHENTENTLTQLIIDKKGRKNTRRMLALIVKCYYYLSDDFIEKIAPKIGLEKNELKGMIDKIRAIRQKKDDEIYNMKERIYCQFYRCIVYEKRLSFLHENTPIYNKLKLKLEKARERLENMRKRVSRVRMEATNVQVAEVIGTTKGTIDASLYRLRTKWEIMSKKSGLN